MALGRGSITTACPSWRAAVTVILLLYILLCLPYCLTNRSKDKIRQCSGTRVVRRQPSLPTATSQTVCLKSKFKVFVRLKFLSKDDNNANAGV